MKKFKLIGRDHFYVDDSYSNKIYFTTELVLAGEAGRLLDNMIEDSEDEQDKEKYLKLDTSNIEDIDYILECAGVYIYPYNKTGFKY